jgi:hypothetical protein
MDGEQGGTVVGPLIGACAHCWVVAPPPSSLSMEPYFRGPHICVRRDPQRRLLRRRPPHVCALELDWERGVDGILSGRQSEFDDSTPPSGRFFFL